MVILFSDFITEIPFFKFSVLKSCDEKESLVPLPRIFNLTATSFKECRTVANNIVCYAERSFVSARPRFWFVVASRCFPDKPQYQVKILFGNLNFFKMI